MIEPSSLDAADAPSPPPAPQIQQSVASVDLERAPALAVLGALAALVDLAMNRIGARAYAEVGEAADVLAWMRAGAFPRNLAGVCLLVALLIALSRYLGMAGFASVASRLSLAGSVGIFLPAITWGLFTPRASLPPVFSVGVLFAMVASCGIATLLARNTLRYRDRRFRIGLALVLATAVQALFVIVVATVRIRMPGFAAPLAAIARHGGELTWLLVPVAIAPIVRPAARDSRGWISIAIGAVTGLVVLGAAWAGERELHPYYSTVVYGGFRLAALPEAFTALYAVPIAIGLGAGMAGVTSSDPARRQVGAALLLWVAAGYSPRSPIQLLDLVVAVLLFARAAQAADPEGRRRATLAWNR